MTDVTKASNRISSARGNSKGDTKYAPEERQKQEDTIREHQQISPRRISTETSYRDFLFGAKAQQQKEEKVGKGKKNGR